MKCPNCGNSALEESHKFCFECSYNLQQITSCDAFAEEDGEKNKQSESFDLGTEDTVDEIQRKRKVEGHDEEPTKRKSVETDTVQPSDGSKPAKADPADNAAYPLQNLALPMNAEDTQQQILTTKETARPSDHLRPATTQVLAHGSGIETLDKEILRESENVGDEDGSSSISAVVIEVSPPSVDQSSAPSESSGQSLDHDMEQGGSREDAAPGIPEDEESSANETTRTLSDESQRKRNVERHDEEMTKRKSVETDTVQPSDGSKPAKVNPADNAAYALQNLALPMDTEDSQQHVFTTNEMARPSDQLRPATTQVLAHGNGKEKLEKKILRKSEKVGDGDGSGNISAVLIGVSPPSVDQSSAPSESSGQSLDHDMEQGDSREDATPGIPDHEDGESSANETTRTLSDESQRKRNVEGHDEEPAKRKSVETDTVQPSDGSTPAKVNPADNAAYALQNLALPMNTEDPQQQVLDTQKTARPSDGDGSGSISAVLIGVSPPSVDQSSAPSESSGQSLDHDREQGDSREDATPGIPDHEDGESSANETTRTMSDKPSSSEDLPYTDLESSQDVNRAVEEVASTDVGENGEDEEYDSKDEDEDESDSQCKDTASVGGTGKTKQGKPKRNKIAIKSKREKKAEQRKKNENEAKQSNRNERGSARPSDVDRAVSSIPGGKGPTKGTNNASEEQEKTGKEKGQEYFCKDNRPKITLVFHAVLDPHFKFEKNLGDKVVMRFGGPAFGDFSENVVELQFKRCLQNDYLLFNGELRAPVALVHRRVLYKYVVVRKGREKNEKDKFLWEHIDTGGQQNRCLVIPEGRRQAETVWHQYDDTIFGTPSWVQSMRSKLPFWKSMDPTEGRIIATLCMLPQWEGFVVGDGDRQITAWEAIERVKDVAYCMTQTLLEDHKQFRLNVPRGYHFDKVLKDFLKPKVERNALLLTSTTDDGETISVLVSSLAIAHVVVHHKVQLDNDCYRSLLQCLIHWSEPQKQKCTDFETLLKYFPGEHLRTLGESLLSICRQMAKDHFDFQDWLFVVPLAHFLTGQSEPFSNSRLPTDAVKEKEEIWSGSKELETKAVRNKLEKETPRKPDNVGDGNRSGSISAVLIGVSPPSTDQSSAPSESFGQSLDHDVEQGGSREDALSKIPEDEESSANETTTTLPDKQSSDEDQPYTDAKSAQYIDRAVKEGPPSDTGENREDEEYDSKDEDEEERHSECKDTASGGGTGKTKQGKPKRNKSAIKSKREKKAERKKKKARQSNKNERGSAKPSDVVRVVSSIPGGKGPDKGTNNASEKQEETGKEKREEYFCKDNRPKITLVFHAVLAPHFKFEEHQGDKVVMRFGGLEFGEFKEDVVELQLEKCLENNYLLFNGKLRAPVALVSRRVSYKYAVARKGRENNEDKFLWEHIDTGGPKNRCLVIPEGRRQAETVWHQYDDTIFSTPNLVQSMRNIIPFCKSMDPTEGRTIATLCMLPQWEGFVVADGDKQITAWDAIERVKDVAYCMTQTWMEENNIPKRNVPRRYHFDKVLKDFLQPKVERNASLRTSTTDDGEKILVLVSSLAIAHVVVHHKVQLDNDCYHSLLQCLILWSEPQKEKCTAFETLLEHFPGDYLGTLGQSLLSICRQRAKEHSDFHDWLLVVPLAHFLTGQSQPFNKSTLLVDVPKEKDELWWGSEGLDTKAVRNRTFGEHSSPWSLIKMISPLFELDPLFRRTFLLVVPCREFGKIAASKMFPPAEVYASLARILSEEDHLIEEQRQVVATTLKELLKNTQQAHQESTTSSSADAEILLRKSFLSATSCVHILKTIVSSCDLNLLLDCLGSISLWTAGLLRRTDADKAEKRESDLPVRDITQKTLDNVKKWLDKTLPRTMPCYDKTLVQRELQTWSKLFELCEKVDYCQEMWIPRLLEMLKGRLEQCDCNGLVELFSKTSMAECRNVVQDLVSESTYKKVEGMLESEGGNEQVFRNLSEQGLNSPQAKECGKLLTLMLTRCWPWPQGCDQTNPLGVLRHVLTWRLWPCFLQRFGRESDYRLVLKPDGQGILMMAITSLEATVGDLKSGNIEFQVLRLLLDQPDRFLELCDHIAGKRGQKTPLKGILERRRIELKAFLEERENVSNFVKMCAFLKRVDVDGLSKKSIQEAFRLSINELAQSEIVKGEFVPRVTFFGLTEKEKYMISHLVKLRDSVLLRTFWCENGTKALIKIAKREPPQTMLNVNDVSELVWEPSINVLSVIQDAFVSGSISFRDIDKYFGIFKGGNRYDDLNRELEHATCSNDTLQRRIQQVRQYDKIQHCIDAAKNIWDFKEALHLKGNFQLVDELRNQLNDEFKERALDSMNQSLERTTQLLGKVTPKRAECLAAVVLCKPLVDWLRTAVGGHQELMTLVDLAWLSAGETPMEHAKIACFHTSCLGFAPLIFDVKSNFGFDEVMKACEAVWNAVDSDPQLPNKLIQTSLQQGWWEGVRTSLGSVATSSLEEAKVINERGLYHVGCPDWPEGTSAVSGRTLNHVIRVTVPSETNGDSKKFGLDDLKDLQSKLMLIAAKATHGKEDVDRFVEIFQGVLRLGTLYLALCEEGEASYLSWRQQFQSTPELVNRSLIDDLNNQGDAMEKCLQQWKKEMHTKRLQYSELNYFTTQQLLILRSHLASVLGRGPNAVDKLPLEVYTLLESVFPDIEPDALKSALINSGICLQPDTDFTRSFGAAGARRPEAISTQPLSPSDRLPSSFSSTKEQIFQSLVAKVDELNYSEEVALAAMIACGDVSEADLLLWCIKNGHNDELVSTYYSEGLNHPGYAHLVTKADDGPSEEETYHSDESDMPYLSDTVESMEVAVTYDQTAGGKYLSLDELGSLLMRLHSQGPRKQRRRFPEYLKRGRPNLVVVPGDDVLGTVLSLYMYDKSHALPSSEEVLICHTDTTAEEMELFWRRSLGDKDGRLFCLVHADVVDFNVAQKAANALEFLLQEPHYNRNEGLCLIIICSSENEDRAYIVAALDQYRLSTVPRCASSKDIRQYFKEQFKSRSPTDTWFRGRSLPWTAAAELDQEKLSVRVVSSETAGAGKSLVVRRLSERLLDLENNDVVTHYPKEMDAPLALCVTVPVYGPVVNQRSVVKALLPHSIAPNLPLSRIFHLDIHPSATVGLDTFLFNLLVLGVLTSTSGQVWRRRSSDLFVIEITSATMDKRNGKEEPMTRLPLTSKRATSQPFYCLLPTIHCVTPRQTLLQLRNQQMVDASLNPLFDDAEFRSTYVQRAFQYLKLWEAGQCLDNFQFVPGLVMGDHAECLKTLMSNCGIFDPSWAELRYFVNFLNSQLHACEESSFCDTNLVGDTLVGFRTFVVQFMILMSRDFATPSLSGNNAAQGEENHFVIGDDIPNAENNVEVEMAELSLRRRWETSSHPYIFFNYDRITMTFMGFHIDRDGNLIDPDLRVVIERNLMSRHLRTGLFVQRVDMETNYESWSKGDKIEKLCAVMGVEWPYDPDGSYELTTDNLKKILAIHMRFRSGIPVVIMGETGCGKTRLIRYMCGLQSGPGGPKNMLLMKVHGGTSCEDILKKVEQAEEIARLNDPQGVDTVLFFDEANTTDALGMIKEVMVDRKVNGRQIGVGLKRLQFIAACNPYRKHTEEMIDKLESAGLGYHVNTQDTRDRIGRIPLRHLVYRVHALPESMRPLVWDFGQLNPEIEELYTRQIVSRFIIEKQKLPGGQPVVNVVTAVLTASQRYMRSQTEECSFVSLRDVERAMNVMVWFYSHRGVLNPLMDNIDEDDADTSDDEDSDDNDEDGVEDEEEDELDQPIDDVTRALVLSLGVCYHARLQDREPYSVAVAQSFDNPCTLVGGHRRILQEITRCQQAVLNELELGPNIGRNTALSENVFMMVVCIELRIPLFVIGKPGSSKSLAKTVVADNMQGDASQSDLFKTFKQAHMVSYQCSPLSTAEGIMATFRQCGELQKEKNLDKYVSVVVLDEVGLAEDSPLMPLKTLHPLLEDGVAADDDIMEVENRPSERVAFIGISNWALDPSKMNRGIMLSRTLPDMEELVESAMGICSTDQQIQSLVAPLINPLAQGYSDLYKEQGQSPILQESKKDEFFGLRDFYSLVKMVYWVAEESRREPRWPEVEHAIRRNFGGLDEVDPVRIFKKRFVVERDRSERKNQNEDNNHTLTLIKASLKHPNTRGESRYLLVLTENYAALPVVQQELLKENEDPVVIFGSSFPKDQEYTQICRNINRIKVCMETGKTVILLNLESLYESLYDALNQYYVYAFGVKYVDLGFGTHRVKCRVHDKFRLIVLAERDVVYSEFPIPLINRLEKHYLVTSASLSARQKCVVKRLEDWVTQFSRVQTPLHQQRRKFSSGDAFVGYNENAAASVVLQVCNALEHDHEAMEFTTEGEMEEKIFRDSQELLLNCATPDAVARLPCSGLDQQADDLWTTYFRVQKHSSLTAFLTHVLSTNERREHEGLLIQVTTHSRLLSSNDLREVAEATLLRPARIACLSLQQFHTEQQFCSSVREFFGKLGGSEGLLLVQCDSGDLNFNLIACARHLLVDQRKMAEENFTENVGRDSLSFVHIVMIVQLPRRVGGCPMFVGFQGGRWLCVHIDELRPPTGQIPAIEFMVDRSVSELFDVSPVTAHRDVNEFEDEGSDNEMETSYAHVTSVADKVDVVSVLRSCVQAAVARIDDESSGSSRSTQRIQLMLQLLPENASGQTDWSFATILARRIHKLLQEKDIRAGTKASDWLRSEALRGTGIQENGTFRRALWQRLFSSVIPLLSEVVAFIDRDSNLDLAGDGDNWLTHLWLSLFQRDKIVDLQYDSFLSLESGTIRERVPLVTSGRDRHVFDCQFPFSWLLNERIDAMWRGACSVSANSHTPVLQCLQDAVKHSEVGDLLDEIRSDGYEEAAVLRYLHDFVHMVHKPTVPGEEKLVSQAIEIAAREMHARWSSGTEFALSLSLIHVVYDHIEQRLAHFTQLVQAQPNIVTSLLHVIPSDDSEMVLDAVALQLCLAQLEPKEEELDDRQTRQVWCNRVLSIRPSADNMINNPAQGGPKTAGILRDCRSLWERISAVRLFIEHTCSGRSACHQADIKNIFRLWRALGDETDFRTPQTMRVIEKFLVDCSEAVSKRYINFGVTSCPVCLEGFVDKDPVRIPCGHVICLVCMSQWIGKQKRCPVCKQDVPDDFTVAPSKRIKKAIQEHCDFRRRCNSFFMELVSTFCFGSLPGGQVMDSELFTMFLSYVINARSQTKHFSPFPEHGIDATPVVRSFLLKQLMRNRHKEVGEHVTRYLSRARGLTHDVDHMLQVCQLFVNCKEDALVGQYSRASDNLLVMIKLAQDLFEESAQHLTSSSLRPNRELDVVVLESVAKARYAMTLAAEFMFKSCTEHDNLTWRDIQIKSELRRLMECVRRTCYKTLSPVPRLYLLKHLVRRFGADSIQMLCKQKDCEWILPAESRDKQEEVKVPDRFVVYGECYRNIREAMAKTVLSGTQKELSKWVQSTVLDPVPRNVIVLLSEYREVTTCHAFTSPQRQLTAKAQACIKEFLIDERHLSAEARPLALQLLDNTQGAAYPALRAAQRRSALEQSLGEIVVHTAAVLHSINQTSVCEPLRLLIENPAILRNCYLPSMPDDNLEEAMASVTETGQWYQCPKGHPYYIGDCGRPVEVKVCPECKVNIGGRSYALSQGNTIAQRGDRTMTGHVLGDPIARPKVLAPERNLSSVVVAIVRVLLHSAMLEGASYHAQDIAYLVHPAVSLEALGRFLWDHLRFDVEALARGLGKSVDDAVLCMHMILAEMTARTLQQPPRMNVASGLNNKAARRNWETAFAGAVVTPVLRNLDERIQQALELLVADERLGNNPLMRQLYEVDVPSEDLTDTVPPTCPALWMYRTQVTLEHVSHTFQQEVTSSDPKRNQVLGEFLRQEHSLRAVRFLPDIVKLQRLLMEKFHRRIDRKEAEQMSLHTFFRKMSSDVEREEFRKLTASFKTAWNLVRLCLNQQGRLRPPSDLCEKIVDNMSPVAVLLPSTSGMGICSTALVYYLTCIHNEFNERYQNLTGGNVKDLVHVQMKDVTTSHLIAYDPERDLLPLILAQCNYSLEVGRGTLVQYNWDALERQLIDRFIRGRPLVDFKDQRFAFSRDVQLDSVFASVRTKIPQTPLNAAISRQIVGEFRSLTDICDVLHSLDIAIGFLSSAGGSPEMPLAQYLRCVLRMPQENNLRSLKAQQCCQLRHVISLWRLLSLERARTLINRGEDPFDQIIDTYKQVMSQTQMMKFSSAMRRVDLDLFVSEVLELILLNLKGDVSPGEEEMSLGDYIQWHLDNKGSEPVPGLEDLPPEVLLKHVVSAWQLSVELSESYHEKRDSAAA